MKLFDAASGDTRELVVGDTASIYVCGITPYASAHIGHAFTFLAYDLIRRRLEDAGTSVRLVRNITDVDEPMYVKARELGIHYLELARQESAEFQAMMRAINLRDADVEPRPSEHIAEISHAVEELLQRNHAYALDGDIYFDVASFQEFGSVSRYPEELLIRLSGMRGGDPGRHGKKHPLDFLLWKAVSDPDDPAAWDTPIGHGRPGWHIECTVMSQKYLGDTIDIHGGGYDLIFPHHACELAQNHGLWEQSPVRRWVHVAPMLLGGEKMSKSLGNLVFVRDLLDRVDPSAIRIALMGYHYRTGGEWRDDKLRDADELLGQIKQAAKQPSGADPRPYIARVRLALDNDLDTPAAIDALRELTQSLLSGGDDSSSAVGLLKILALLGINVPA